MNRKDEGCLYCRPDKACLVCVRQFNYLDVARTELERRAADPAKHHTAA